MDDPVDVLGALVAVDGRPDVGRHVQDLLEPLLLVERLGEAQPGPGDARPGPRSTAAAA